jgi:hypothetical protein
VGEEHRDQALPHLLQSGAQRGSGLRAHAPHGAAQGRLVQRQEFVEALARRRVGLDVHAALRAVDQADAARARVHHERQVVLGSGARLLDQYVPGAAPLDAQAEQRVQHGGQTGAIRHAPDAAGLAASADGHLGLGDPGPLAGQRGHRLRFTDAHPARHGDAGLAQQPLSIRFEQQHVVPLPLKR